MAVEDLPAQNLKHPGIRRLNLLEVETYINELSHDGRRLSSSLHIVSSVIFHFPKIQFHALRKKNRLSRFFHHNRPVSPKTFLASYFFTLNGSAKA